VVILKQFRDTYLLTSGIGRKLVGLYYRHSPRPAAFIAKHETVRALTRVSLVPVVAASYLVLKLGPTNTFILLFVFVVALLVLFSLILAYHPQQNK